MSNFISEEDLIEQYSGRVYNLSLKLMGDATAAEDLAQESLIKALKALEDFRGDSQVGTWLYRITLNTWKNRLRYEKSRADSQTLSLDASPDGASGPDGDRSRSLEIPADEPPPGKAIESEQTAVLVNKALQELDPESRAIVILRENEAKSYREIADALDIPEGTVKSRLSRAREELRIKLLPLIRQEQ
ncbi:MAG: sigma-70 family RNA polymerase sigma factor [Elusimicrobia bacterium]|nr:sigma-70 family RNA polymerase sigma factor [Elusimicrobiota bacterium]